MKTADGFGWLRLTLLIDPDPVTPSDLGTRLIQLQLALMHVTEASITVMRSGQDIRALLINPAVYLRLADAGDDNGPRKRECEIRADERSAMVTVEWAAVVRLTRLKAAEAYCGNPELTMKR